MAQFNLSLKPIQTEVQIKPGGTFVQAYEVTNNSDSALLINTTVKPWVPLNTGGQVDYLHAVANPSIQFSLQNTDLILNRPFYLKPKEKKQIVLKVKLDAQTSEGDSYYTFFITQDTYNQNNLFGQIGTHLLISSSKTAAPPVTASVTNLHVGPQIKDFLFSELTLSATVNNDSKFFFKTPLKISLTKNNQAVSETTIEPQNVLAFHSRQFETTLSPPFWPGFYTATASLPSEFGNVTTSTSFYIFPYSLLIFTTFLFLLFFFIKKLSHHKK